jgi:hypothetical protein
LRCQSIGEDSEEVHRIGLGVKVMGRNGRRLGENWNGKG